MAKVVIREDNVSLQRINEKCIDCGQCLETCKSKNHLVGEDCINCGQCIMTCPMGALVPKYNYKEILANIHDEEKITVVSISPAVRVAIGDEFGYAPGEFLEGKLVGVLKELGFDYVFDTTFGADLTIMEEATELVKRIEKNENLPMFTSCCPSWVLYMEKYHPNDLNHLSTCKSPIGMQGAIIKNYFAKMKNLNPSDIVTVSLAPCVSKKSEIKSDENNNYVMTTSELAMLIREQKIDFKECKEGEFDSLLGKGSGAGVIFGTSGGVMEAALRTAYFLLNGRNAPSDFLHLEPVRGSLPIKEATVDLGVKTIKVAVLYGIENVSKMYPSLNEYQFIEVMTCPTGCIGGGGQPVLPMQKLSSTIDARSKSLYENDANLKIRNSYENEEVKKVYEAFLEKPLSEKSEEFLHQSYIDKSNSIQVIE